MKNKTFLMELKKELRGFPKEEKEEILTYYSEYLEDSEEKPLPTPKEIVCSLLQEEIKETEFLPKLRKIMLKAVKQNHHEAECLKSIKWYLLFLGLMVFLFHTFCGVLFAYGDDTWMVDPETGMAKDGFFLVQGILVGIILAFQYFMVKSKKLPIIQGKAMAVLIVMMSLMWLSWSIALSIGNTLWSLFAQLTFMTPMAFHNSQYWTSGQFFVHYMLDFIFFYPLWWFYVTVATWVLVIPFHLIAGFLQRKTLNRSEI